MLLSRNSRRVSWSSIPQLRDEQWDQPSGIGSAETSGTRDAGSLAGLGRVRGAGRPTGQHHVVSRRERFPGAGLPHPHGAAHPAGDPKGARMERRSPRGGWRRSETTGKRWGSLYQLNNEESRTRLCVSSKLCGWRKWWSYLLGRLGYDTKKTLWDS